MKNLKNKIKNRIKERKGSIFIEYAIGLLIFVVFVGFCVCVLTIGLKHYYIGEEMAVLQRTVSVQSGFETKTPTQFPGGGTAYQTSKEIYNAMDTVATNVGFEKGSWKLYYEETDNSGKVVRSGYLSKDTEFKADYQDKISIQFIGKYNWDVLSTSIPGIAGDKIMSVERIAFAEYIRNYDQ